VFVITFIMLVSLPSSTISCFAKSPSISLGMQEWSLYRVTKHRLKECVVSVYLITNYCSRVYLNYIEIDLCRVFFLSKKWFVG